MELHITISNDEAWSLAQLLKRLQTRDIGPSDLSVVTNQEKPDAEKALAALRKALRDSGCSPR